MSTINESGAASTMLDVGLPEVARQGGTSMSMQNEVPWPSMEQSFERPLSHVGDSSEWNGKWGQTKMSDAEKVTRR
jgi:hypothetical protein